MMYPRNIFYNLKWKFTFYIFQHSWMLWRCLNLGSRHCWHDAFRQENYHQPPCQLRYFFFPHQGEYIHKLLIGNGKTVSKDFPCFRRCGFLTIGYWWVKLLMQGGHCHINFVEIFRYGIIDLLHAFHWHLHWPVVVNLALESLQSLLQQVIFSFELSIFLKQIIIKYTL